MESQSGMITNAEHIESRRGSNMSAEESVPAGSLTELIDAVGADKKRMLLHQRILLVEYIFLIAKFFANARITGIQPRHKRDIDSIMEMCEKLSAITNKDKKIFIRFRGRGIPGEEQKYEKFDYVVRFGNMTIEIPLIKAFAKRGGATASHLPWRLIKAFEGLAALNINTLCIDLDSSQQEGMQRLYRSFQILADYLKAIYDIENTPPASMPESGPPSVVYNEKQQPDPNLTLLARVNNVQPASLQALVPKIAQAIQNASPDSGLAKCSGVFDAIFHFNNLQAQLARPPLELNNVRWVMVAEDQEVVSTKNVSLSREVIDRLVNSPQKAYDVLENIYGDESISFNTESLEHWLDQISQLIRSLAEGGKDKEIENEALRFAKTQLENVSDEVLTNLAGKEAGNTEMPGPAREDKEKLHPEISGMVNFLKQRSVVRKKMRNMLHNTIVFDDADYEILAGDFGIPVADAKLLINLLRQCFDDSGRFLRKVFEKNIPELIRYEKHIFQLLWHYLKEIMHRADRVPYLNSLQLLIARLQRPHQAIQTLLADFVRPPLQVSFFDRNALILSNILIRKYNKELRNDVEITPEEVLMVRDGLDEERVRISAAFIVEHQEAFRQKIRMVHEMLEEAIAPQWTSGSRMPIRYLANLEREIYIFLSLSGGDAAHNILREAGEAYGNPEAKIYVSEKSPLYMKTVVQLFKIVIRGLERFTDKNDLPLLKEIRSQENQFFAVIDENSQTDLVKKIITQLNASIRAIQNTIP